MIEVEVIPGTIIKIDDEDKRIVDRYKWFLHANKKNLLANVELEGKRCTFTMAKIILFEYGHVFGKNELVCYKDRDHCNNVKSNFTVIKISRDDESRAPVSKRGGKGNRELPYGVYHEKRRGTYRATITFEKKPIWLGEHKTIKKAKEVVKEAMAQRGFKCRNGRFERV